MISILLSLIDILIVLLPVLLSVAFMTIIERKQLAAQQRRVGPVKWFGKLQKWVKLSNSGDILKLIVPNYSRKVISVQNNYLGNFVSVHTCALFNTLTKAVTSYKIKETAMGYRGSKSVLLQQKASTLKEQRVDGSWSFKTITKKCS